MNNGWRKYKCIVKIKCLKIQLVFNILQDKKDKCKTIANKIYTEEFLKIIF